MQPYFLVSAGIGIKGHNANGLCSPLALYSTFIYPYLFPLALHPNSPIATSEQLKSEEENGPAACGRRQSRHKPPIAAINPGSSLAIREAKSRRVAFNHGDHSRIPILFVNETRIHIVDGKQKERAVER